MEDAEAVRERREALVKAFGSEDAALDIAAVVSQFVAASKCVAASGHSAKIVQRAATVVRGVIKIRNFFSRK